MIMELRQLEYFVAVAAEANFTRAAAKLHVAQPGVSAQVRRLERELGQPLLDRSERTVRLTEAGVAVLPDARAALAAVAGARLAVDELTGLMRGHVAIGMVTSHSIDLPGLLASFHHDHPAVEISLSEGNSDQLIRALHAGQLDLAVIGLTTPPRGIATEVITDEPLVAVVSHDDALAARATITLAAIQDRTLMTLPRGTGVRALIDDACARAGFQPRIAFEASDPQVLAQLAGRGLGMAILPESLATAHRTELHALTVTRPRLRGRLALAWRAQGPISPAARTLISHARSVLVRPSVDRRPAGQQ